MTQQQIEAMKLALEALEANQPVNYCMNNNGEKFPMMQEDPFRFERNTKAITALEEVLAQPEQEQFALKHRIAELEGAVIGLQARLAQPQQEPMTWRNAAIRVGEDLCSVGPFGYYDMTAQQWLDWALSVVTVHAPPHSVVNQSLTTEQEPVTYGVDWGKAGDIPCVSITKRLPNDVIELVAVEYAPYSYTTPPQRTWVGLTDEEREEIALEVPMDAVLITEAKLKDKNT